MIASADVGYDVILIVHIMVAVAVFVVLVSLRVAARGAATNSDHAQLARRFPDRPDWAARLVHVLPVTGLVLSLLGDNTVSLRQPWVDTGIVLYLVLAYWLEARTLPSERKLARAIARSDDSLAAAARQLGRELDGALLVLAVLFVTMIVQF